MTIESNIPIPARVSYNHPKPNSVASKMKELATSAIGDSVLIKGVKRNSVNSTTYLVGGSGWTTTRVVDGGVRVWKIAEPQPQ